MKDYVIKKIDDSSRDKIRYVSPIESNETIAKYISAFANTDGGVMVYGVKDDGNRLTIKNCSFEINEDKVRKYLDDDVEFECGRFNYGKSQLVYIYIHKSKELIRADNIAYELSSKNEAVPFTPKKVFLSYCENDCDIANIIQSKIENRLGHKVYVSRYTKDVKYKQSLSGFMQSIEEHDYVVSIISDKYLKSDGCMYEISELMRDRKYYDKLLFVILSENDIFYYKSKVKVKDIKADVYSINRFKYIEYWKDKKKKIDGIVNIIADPSLAVEATEESKKISIILLKIGEFIDKLKDGMGIRLREMIDTEFEDFINNILS